MPHRKEVDVAAVVDVEEGSRVGEAYDALRRKVLGMHPGVPLPPVPELMAELSSSRVTLDKVYNLLEQQGLIERKWRKGVFVADRLTTTGEVAIVLKRTLLDPGASRTYALACSGLRGALHDFNPKWAVKLHLGEGTVSDLEMFTFLDLLEPTVLPRLRGVLSFHSLQAMEAKLAAADVPVVYVGTSAPWGPGVFLDHDRMVRDGIRRLAEAGCRRVALLWSWMIGQPTKGGEGEVAAAAAADCGVEFREEGIGHDLGGWTERHGYELFMRLWWQPERPDGVMVVDDVLCHGVLRAIQELRVNLPGDLRLVTHANRGIDFPYPRPVSRVEFDLNEWTGKAVKMLETRIRGGCPEPTAEYVQATWIKGETT